MANELAQSDLDYIARTIIGEAGNQPPEGQAAVAHVIMNRMNSDGYGGRTARQIIFAPNQFETWAVRPQELMAIPRTSPAYQNALAIAQGVATGEIDDPTGGATFFMNPEIVRQRNGGRIPQAWAQGPGQEIGDHVFFKPKGAAMAQAKQTVPDYLGMALKSAPTMQAAPSESAAVPDYLGMALAKAPDAAAAPAGPPMTMPPGYRANAGSMVPVPDETLNPASAAYTGNRPATAGASEFMERTARPMANLPSGVGTVAKDYGNRLVELLGQSGGMMTSGAYDVLQNRPATGLGKMGLGAISMPASVVGALDVPVTKATGNKEFGERLPMAVGTGVIAHAATAASPAVSAVKDIIKDIGPQNIPALISRLERNPNLTVMDISPAVRGNAAGMANNPANAEAMNSLNLFTQRRMAQRAGSTRTEFEKVLGETPNVKETVDALKEQARNTGRTVINPVVENAAPVDVSPVIRSIDSKFSKESLAMLKAGKEPPGFPDEKKRLWDLRQRLAGDASADNAIMTPKDAHALQMDLRRMGSDPQLGYQARSTRRELVNQIDDAANGKYKPALKQYADDKSVDEAFRHGFDMFANPTSAEKALANHPDNWKAWAQDASQAELDAVKKGIMVGARQRIMEMRKGNFIPEEGFTHERLAAIVGKKDADDIVRTLNDWRDMAETHNVVAKNSATAQRLAGQKAREVRSSESNPQGWQRLVAPATVAGSIMHLGSGSALDIGGALPVVAGASALAASAIGKGARMARSAHDVASNTAYAKWAAATGDQRETLLNILRAEANKEGGAIGKLKSLVANPARKMEGQLMRALPR